MAGRGRVREAQDKLNFLLSTFHNKRLHMWEGGRGGPGISRGRKLWT